MAISSDIKLRVYNRALFHLGSRRLLSLSENREPRRVMDEIWGANNEFVGYALERAGWNFAMRTSRLQPDDSLEVEFGPQKVYVKPDDFVRLEALGADEYFNTTYTSLEYTDETDYWLTDNQPLYVRYVSDGDEYGHDSSRWTETFKEYLSYRLAYLSCERITKSSSLKAGLAGEMDRELGGAKSRDAMDEGTKFPQMGGWARSRSSGNRGYKKNRGSLLG